MSGGFIPNDPTLGLALLTFRDEYATGELDARGYPRRGRSGEQAAAAFWLEHRNGPPQRSLSDLEPVIGRSLSGSDIPGTVEAIGRCLEVVPSSWRAVTVVAAGWRVGVEQLRASSPPDGGPPWLERAGLPTALPQGLSRYALNVRTRVFREELIRRRLIIGAEMEESMGSEPRAARWEDPVGEEQWIVGWKGIGCHLGVSHDTAERWSREQGLPVYQPVAGGRVRARPSELDEWAKSRAA